ncbi:MAG: amidohydrolase family protein [Oscillospiraceae bacterium]|jgi:predicted TIM-barrel fold metal-dependent hydrolase|nr:amidohydrolase family protein [Oscillospiraceae bacterium]
MTIFEGNIQAIHEEIEKMTIIDTHEHLYPERECLKFDADAFMMFRHYCRFDLIAAGMKEDKIKIVFDSDAPLMQRWREFKPYYEAISNSTYVQSAHIAMERFYGENRLTDGNVEIVTQRIKDARKPGLYANVIRDACNIETCLNQGQNREEKPLFSYPDDPLLTPVSNWINNPRAYESVAGYADLLGRDVGSVEDLVDAARLHVRKVKKHGGVGIKFPVFPMSYPDMAEAKEAFARIIKDKTLWLPPENPIANVFYDALLREAQEQDLVACIHTGYWFNYRELNPSHGIFMFDHYPDVSFDLYHVGYPYVREAIMLGKSRGNVWMNMCWTYIISPHFACDALTEMLEMVPWTKIIGFGGDYAVAEKIYGHLVLARRVMAKALATKVCDGAMTLDKAISLAHHMLYQNPKNLYKL